MRKLVDEEVNKTTKLIGRTRKLIRRLDNETGRGEGRTSRARKCNSRSFLSFFVLLVCFLQEKRIVSRERQSSRQQQQGSCLRAAACMPDCSGIPNTVWQGRPLASLAVNPQTGCEIGFVFSDKMAPRLTL